MTEYMKEGWQDWIIVDIALLLSTIAYFRDFAHKDKIKRDSPPPKSTGEQKDKRPKIRGSIFKRILPVTRPGSRQR